MKKILLMLLLITAGITIHAQVIPETDVPKAVTDQYNKDFPNIKAKRWELNKNIKQYVAVTTNAGGVAVRARYKEDGSKIWHILSYTANQVPSAVSAATLAAYPGFKVDWATEVIDFTKNTDVYDLRLSKAGYVLHAYVKPDGTVFSDAANLPDQLKPTDVQPK